MLEAFLKEMEISSLTQGVKVDKEARDSASIGRGSKTERARSHSIELA